MVLYVVNKKENFSSFTLMSCMTLHDFISSVEHKIFRKMSQHFWQNNETVHVILKPTDFHSKDKNG